MNNNASHTPSSVLNTDAASREVPTVIYSIYRNCAPYVRGRICAAVSCAGADVSTVGAWFARSSFRPNVRCTIARFEYAMMNRAPYVVGEENGMRTAFWKGGLGCPLTICA